MARCWLAVVRYLNQLGQDHRRFRILSPWGDWAGAIDDALTPAAAPLAAHDAEQAAAGGDRIGKIGAGAIAQTRPDRAPPVRCCRSPGFPCQR
jgi:hypothetical protein